MASISIIFRKQKIRTDKSVPIFIRVLDGQSCKFYSTGVTVKEHDWDKEEKRVKPNHQDSVALNAIITKTKREIEKNVLSLQADGDSPDIIQGLKQKQKKETWDDFFLFADKFTADLEAVHKYTRHSGEKSRINNFRAFIGKRVLGFNEIDVSLLNDFKTYLKKTNKCSERTVMNAFVTIRTVYNLAVREGIADKNFYPFGIGKIIIRFPETLKIGLTAEEVKSIENADFSNEPLLEEARDIWLFSFYLAGIRISDVLRMKWKDCIDGRLVYRMGKNSKIVSLKMPDKAAAILDRYRKDMLSPDDFIFPALKEVDEANLKAVYSAIVTGNHKCNKYLKTVATSLKLSKKLTCHIARHTFGSITADKISPQMLQKLYRHTDIKTTMGY